MKLVCGGRGAGAGGTTPGTAHRPVNINRDLTPCYYRALPEPSREICDRSSDKSQPAEILPCDRFITNYSTRLRPGFQRRKVASLKLRALLFQLAATKFVTGCFFYARISRSTVNRPVLTWTLEGL